MSAPAMFGVTLSTVAREPDGPAGVRALALQLMAEHGLGNWSLAFDWSVTRAGICRRRERQLGLSEPLLSLWTEAQQRDVILHEIAHALTRGGHGPEWKRMCTRIGADPSRTWDANGDREVIPGRFTGTCPNGHTVTRHRRPRIKAVSCTRCSRKFDTRYLITWSES